MRDLESNHHPRRLCGSRLLNRLFKACLFESQLLAFRLKSWVLEAPQNMLLARPVHLSYFFSRKTMFFSYNISV
jgi:hypothetical protein